MIDELLSDEGWPYASTPPVEEGDPGRFHCLFGRDSLITALQLLPERPEIARATLAGLAARQGRDSTPARSRSRARSATSSATPPRASSSRPAGPASGGFAYYGTADATSWYVVLAARAGGFEDATRKAGEWLAGALDRGGGLVRHAPGRVGRAHPAGLARHARPDRRLRRRHPAARRHAARAAAGRPGLAGRRVRGAAGARLGRPRRCPARAAVGARAGGRWRSRRAIGSCRARARSSAGCCGRTRSTTTRASARPSGCAGPTSSRSSGCGRCRATRRCSSRTPTTAARSGRSTPGSAGAACAPPAAPRRPSACAPACWPRSTGLGRAPELYAVNVDGEVEPVALSNRVQAWTVGARWALENEWDGRPPRPSQRLR